ncbi:hypothetical protein [Clostridium kluyveri]|uniref:hypothetical protein n=1 Tax=Clostridium kluyveri TaxID=1534 RepID=UPI002AFE771F|nr:hypothetical protein [Clostridium kluyveri]
MNQIVINNILIPIIGAGIGTIIEIGRRQIKNYLDIKEELIQKQKEAVIQSMGIERYNRDVKIVQNTVKTVEQLGKEFDWKGAVKHSKVMEFIKGKTGLSDDEIYNIIKGTVLEVNNIVKVPK